MFICSDSLLRRRLSLLCTLQGRALNFAYLCGAAYCPPASVDAWTCKSCEASSLLLSDIFFFSDNASDCKGFVGVEGFTGVDNVYLAYEGSSNIPMWINNMKTVMVGCGSRNTEREIKGTTPPHAALCRSLLSFGRLADAVPWLLGL